MVELSVYFMCFFFNDTATTEIYTLSLHDALPIYLGQVDQRIELDPAPGERDVDRVRRGGADPRDQVEPAVQGLARSEEHTSELQSQFHLVCRLLLEKKKKSQNQSPHQPHTTSDNP